ncbi:MarR family winged helix-turn-helix transcriptional regulator [Microbulbifer discodermiae]|uniref:MarR family winged helix-turn-helix transcriptional regulator n=1 Tax=Microbulbifer sp. 2201CG32-9 TaxID=3232309 RepID=UPI00345C51C8
MNSQQRQKLNNLLDLVGTIGKVTKHEDMSLHQLKVLLLVAVRDAYESPADSREIAEALGLSTSGVSRAVASLGEHGRGKSSGLGLLETHIDPEDRRRKFVQLSRKGVKALTEIVAAAK